MILPAEPPWHGAALHGGWVAVGLLVVAYCVAGEPLLGRRVHSRFLARVGHVAGERVRYYLLLIGWELAFGAAALVLAAVVPGLSTSRMGLRLPPPDPTGSRDSVMAGFVLVVVVASAVGVVLQRRRLIQAPVGEAVAAMLPRTGIERGLFVVVSLLAGVCEEAFFRGLVLAVLAALIPPLPPVLVLVVGAALFGLAHLYQGPVGVGVTAAMGLVFGGVYWFAGSLLLAVVIHFALDARQAFALPPPQESSARH